MSIQAITTTPSSHPSPSSENDPEEDDSTPFRKISIVIAEDDHCLRDIMAVKLIALGYAVRCAEDGETGWETLLAESFDLLITDLEMPRLNGLDLLRRMRSSNLNQPAILMSGNMPVRTPEMDTLLTPGVTLAKPFTIPNLLPCIVGLLALSNSRTIPHSQTKRSMA